MPDTLPPELDLNQIATDLIARSAQKLSESVCDKTATVTSEFKIRIGSAFTRYLDQQLLKRSRVRTILYREDPQYIYDFYVPQDLQCGDNKPIRDVGARKLYPASFHTVLTGTGGSGKSFFLRHIFIDTIRETDYVPLFVELKAVNDTHATFESILFKELDLASAGITHSAMLRALKRGVFALLLDGFDEISLENQDTVAKAIREFADESPNTPIIVTARPDERFVGWDGFRQFRLLPLTKPKAQSLITRLKYDVQIKTRFLSDVESTLWESHESFLSNPLLVTIMLLTYSHNASVPSRMHLFYSQVFETLWNRHDASKDGYQRILESKLEKDVFLKVLEGFSFKCYWESKVTLNDGEAHDALRFAIRVAECECSTESVLQDLIKALCILNQDGLSYSFTHRSFQEYYAARFALQTTVEHRSKFLTRIVASAVKDQVLTLMWEMDRSLVEREVLLPFLTELKNTVEQSNGRSKLFNFATLFCDEILVMADGLVRFSGKPSTALLNFILLKYDGGRWKKVRQQFRDADAAGTKLALRQKLSLSFRELLQGDKSRFLPIALFSDDHIDTLASTTPVFSQAAMDFFLDTYKQIQDNHSKAAQSLEELFRV